MAGIDTITIRQVLSAFSESVESHNSALMMQLKGFNALCVSVAKWMGGAERNGDVGGRGLG